MIRIYGIKNCDTMGKAFKWLDSEGKEYEFHNYKEQGIDKKTLERWLKVFPTDKLINTKGTTYRALPDSDKEGITDKKKAIALMMSNTSLIKRPVWDLGDDRLFLGWDEQALRELIAG